MFPEYVKISLLGKVARSWPYFSAIFEIKLTLYKNGSIKYDLPAPPISALFEMNCV